MTEATALSLSPAITKHATAQFRQSDGGSSQHATLDSFLRQLDSPESSAALSLVADTSHPLSHYFISSSHNTYLSGNQLWSRSSEDSYKQVLKQGCRCIEIDLWDGDSPSSSEAEDEASKASDVSKLSGLLKKQLDRLRAPSDPTLLENDSPATEDLMPTPWRTAVDRSEPVVYHGYTATKEISFRKVCEVVRLYAFKRTTLPLIVSLEVHCSPSQQEIVCELIHDYWGDFLLRLPDNFSDTTKLPPLESLQKRILVKVKYVAPQKAKAAQAVDDGEESSTADDAADATKKSKIIEKLSNMGIFTRAFHFRGFDHPTASIPTHVFSLGESKLLEACEEQPEKLFKHNLQFLMRAYPKGTRLRSTNLDPTPFWHQGVQMVALNYQRCDAANMLNFAQFESTGGYVLKPKGFLPEKDGPPSPRRQSFDLSIKIYAGQGLGALRNVPDAYVKCELHVESKTELERNRVPKEGKTKGGEWKRTTSTIKSKDPDYNTLLEFKSVHDSVPELTFVRIKVMDENSYQKDGLLGWICYRLDRIPKGLVLLYLRGEDYKHNGAKLLVRTSINWLEKQ